MVPMNGNRLPKIPIEGMVLPPLLNSVQARKALGDMPESTFRLVTKPSVGPLRTRKIGGKVYVRRADLLAYIDSLPENVGAAA
jgi:hypothetical protein